LSLSWVRSGSSRPPSCFLKIHFNTPIPSTPKFQDTFFHQISPPKSCMQLFFPPYMLHAPLQPQSFFIWSLNKYLVRRAGHEAPQGIYPPQNNFRVIKSRRISKTLTRRLLFPQQESWIRIRSAINLNTTFLSRRFNNFGDLVKKVQRSWLSY
jgi:hypothetical protein